MDLAERDAIIELQSMWGGQGGQGRLFTRRLYYGYGLMAAQHGWGTEVMDLYDSHSSIAIVAGIVGLGAYGELASESGFHDDTGIIPSREVSHPEPGKKRTPLARVHVLPEATEDDLTIAADDIIVNVMERTEYGDAEGPPTRAVEITYVPTGEGLVCRGGSSEEVNRAHAMRLLRSRLFARELAQVRVFR